MEGSPTKFLFRFLFYSIILWVAFIYLARLLALVLSRIVGASVGFRAGGCKSLRDVVLKFEKGPVESVSIGEIGLSLCHSSIKLGAGIFSRGPKLQIVICDLDIVIRKTESKKGSVKGKGTQKTKTNKPRSSGKGKGKLALIANVARFLSVSMKGLTLKTPKANFEIKEMRLDLTKDARMKPSLFIKLILSSISAQVKAPQYCGDQSSSHSVEDVILESQPLTSLNKASSSLSCEELSISCKFGHCKESGIVVKDLDISFGEISVNLNEGLFQKHKATQKVSSENPNPPNESSVDSTAVKGPDKKQALMTKLSTTLPEKASFSVSKISVKFEHVGQSLSVENQINGIQLKSIKSRSTEEVGESTRLDIQLDVSEIHLLKDGDVSLLEILQINFGSSVYIPLQFQPTSAVRAEIDLKIGGTKCSLIFSRLEPLARLRSNKEKKTVLKEEVPSTQKPKSTGSLTVMWTCTVSAPEMTILLYNMSGFPLYHGCLQSSHLFGNNISNQGPSIHAELGELNLRLADENQESLKECLFGVEANPRSLLHIPKVSLDWGKKDLGTTPVPEDGPKLTASLTVNMTGMGIYFTMRRVESLVVTAVSLQAFFKRLSSGKKSQPKGVSTPKSSGKGTRVVKFNLERCSVIICADVGLENTIIEDPKRANYGSQGGRFVVSVSEDGTNRTADIYTTLSDECKKLKYSLLLDIFNLSVCLNKDKQSTQIDLERAKSMYEEHPDDQSLGTKVHLLDIQNAKFVRRGGGLKEVSVYSLFSATDITARWEPDVQISLFELICYLKLFAYNQKVKETSDSPLEGAPIVTDPDQGKETTSGSGLPDKLKKKESVFAVDVEMITISAELGDGVEGMVKVQSIFSENARIGVLLEGLMLSINNCRIVKSGRMQLSRIPKTSNGPDAITIWDFVIQGLDVHICMPFRLELRAIDDAYEDMIRALKLIMASKMKLIFPIKKDTSKPKKPSTSKLGCVRFCIRKVTAELEEEPLQGWLDEHYHLLKNEARELAVRLDFLDELGSKGVQSPSAPDSTTDSTTSAKKITYNGAEIDVHDSSSISKLRDEIYKQSFESYYKACKNLAPSEGSGACKEGFQSGFKPSKGRTSVMSIIATELDVTLIKIEGGEEGMIQIVKRLDPVALENDIPFSRLYGSNFILRAGELIAQIRDYTYPMLTATSGKCEGCIVLAQQATPFQPQVRQDVYVGKWRKVNLLRSATGTTPPMKTFLDLPLHFQKGEVCFGVSYEPVLADISYVFTVALRRAHLSIRNPIPPPVPPKKEKSLPWWDEMRNYIHGHSSLCFSETHFHVFATTDPYEKSDKLQVFSDNLEIQQSDGRISVAAKNFRVFTSSLDNLAKNSGLKLPAGVAIPVIETPSITVEVIMEWGCDSGTPLNHYLFALPNEGKLRDKVYDPFRSTSLSLQWNVGLKPLATDTPNSKDDTTRTDASASSHDSGGGYPIIKIGAHDLAWITKFIGLNYLPPHKLRTFSRWPRFGVPIIPRSGNLSLDRVMTEFMLRLDSSPTCIKYMPMDNDDPAKGLTFNMSKLKVEICNSRGRQKYTFDSKRDTLDLVYQGIDLHVPKVFLDREDCTTVANIVQLTRKTSLSENVNEKTNLMGERPRDDGFFLSSDYFTIRKQTPKSDPVRLSAWQEAGRKNLEMTYVKPEVEHGSDSDDHTRSDPSDDDGYIIADSCQRIFVYGLKLLWNIENRDAVMSFVGGLTSAFTPTKPSPSRQYTQRKLHEVNQKLNETDKPEDDDDVKPPPAAGGSDVNPPPAAGGSDVKPPPAGGGSDVNPPPAAASGSSKPAESSGSPSKTEGISAISIANTVNMNENEEGTRHFMVNVIEPQFNLHSEEANGRFLLAAVSGRVMARSFHSVVQVGHEVMEQALGSESTQKSESAPELAWKRVELSAMLEHVQAHVAPTDVDPGAGVQWLPKIRRSSHIVKRTGALLERVFTPCDMYFRYTRHKGGTPELKVKPLKELTFNSDNITAAMTSRQFQVMLDVLTNLLFARPPKPRRNSLTFPSEEDDDDAEEEADAVVPDGVEEVELEKINVELKERQQNLIRDDIMKLSLYDDDQNPEKEGELWMIASGRSTLVLKLKNELGNVQKARKAASASLRVAMRKAAELRLMEKEKNKSPSFAMRICVKINKFAWSMLLDGKSFAEAEINEMIYDFDRDYKDVGVARFTTKSCVIRNCLPNAKCDTLLAAWNPPPEWGKKVMIRVDAKQGVPKDGNSTLELFQVEIYPLKIHLTEAMYTMMWAYLFPEEEQDSLRRQEVWKVSTTAGLRRVKKGTQDGSVSNLTKESEASSKMTATGFASTFIAAATQGAKQNKSSGGTKLELRRTSSFDKTWEEDVAESVANELMMSLQSSSGKYKDPKQMKPGVRASNEDRKVGKPIDDKKPKKQMEFHNIKISQVELLVTYEGSRFVVSDLRLLMDSFHRVDFTGTWPKLFSRVKKHIIWGVLKSVTGMQGKKFKDKGQVAPTTIPDDLNLSGDSDGGGQPGTSDQHIDGIMKRPTDGAGDGFVTSIKGLFSTQRRKAKAIVLRTMRGEGGELGGDWSDGDAEFSPFARQLTISKAKKLIKRHSKKFHSRKGSMKQRDKSPTSSHKESDSSSSSSNDDDTKVKNTTDPVTLDEKVETVNNDKTEAP